jgi:carbonic anhydrase/acetyltransferase-like protein (isoleucine patch superfamily)
VIPFRGIEPIVPESCFLAPFACIVGDVILGEECSVWFHAVVRGDVHYVRVGRRTNIQDHCVLHVTGGRHPLNVGEEVTVGHGAILHGCTVGDRCLIGMGAKLLDGAKVGSGSIVAAGAVVAPGTEIPPRSLVAGVPARIRRRVEDAELDGIVASAQHYVETAAAYGTGAP